MIRPRCATNARAARFKKPRRHYLRATRTVFAGLVAAPCSLVAQEAPADRGAIGLWQQLLRLRTTASVLYTTGHPDDEQAGVLTLLSRGRGVRLGLLTLNRGEGGANAVGPELFDALGLIRSEELELSGRYYGLANQYYTSAVDYGYSKTLDEAFRSWDRDHLLEDMVRIIRVDRPLVVVSRWHGSLRDGHGHHQAAGVLTAEAARAAGDPSRFPGQIENGLKPWTPLRLYRGGVRSGEPTDVVIDPDQYSPWLGQSYQDFGRFGLSLQRSQTAGRVRSNTGASLARYELQPLRSESTARGVGEPADDFFAGMNVSLGALPDLLQESVPDSVLARLEAAEASVADAMGSYLVNRPSAVLAPLARGLTHIRGALTMLDGASETRFHLRIKERQFQEALRLGVGLDVSAGALDLPSGDGSVAPGQSFGVEVRGRWAATDATVAEVTLNAPPGWTVTVPAPAIETEGDATADPFRSLHAFVVRVPHTESPTRPYFFRTGLADNTYTIADSTALGLAERPPLLTAQVRYVVHGLEATAHIPVTALESDAPFGEVERPVTVVPAVAVAVDEAVRVFPAPSDGAEQRATARPIPIRVRVTNHHPDGSAGRVRLDVPPSWDVQPASRPFSLTAPGETRTFEFDVQPRRTPLDDAIVRVTAVVPDPERGNTEYSEGFQTIRHRDLDTRRLYRDATVTLRAVNARMVADLEVGYVMGVGDQVPMAIEQLGGQVTLLDRDHLATGDLSRFRTIVIGTRAYAVRPDLVAHTDRLLEWTHGGGNLVVLYQTQEFRPELEAPFPARLPRGAEEVSEEDAPVRLLAANHPLMTTPNRISADDFADWVEQRGSKFWREWDSAYTPLVETNDTGQEPQRGVWLTAPWGDGRYSYVALALHRQLPYGVTGAYRILANLLTPPTP